MSKDYQLKWPAHPNVYLKGKLRDFNIYFSEPEYGVNRETGMLLLIPGFGGNANSNVYKKMRSNFADDYNLITVQCDYFGQEFMQESQSVTFDLSQKELQGILSDNEIEAIYGQGFNVNKFIEIGSKYDLNIVVKESLEESSENFNDMGIMQAIDNLTAVHYVIKILEDNNLKFNTKKMILFGQSHGAYLSYLCNALAPSLFSLLIDNSSWLFPTYLMSTRITYTRFGNLTLRTEFDYLAKKMDIDREFLYLPSLYKKFENKCVIKCFHGTMDNLISNKDKRNFCNEIKNCTYHEISEDKLDGQIFKSTQHGLEADFLKLFEYVMDNKEFENSMDISYESVTIRTKKKEYKVNYRDKLPVVILGM